LSAHPTSGYFVGPYTVSNSSFASPNTNPSVTADGTGRVHFAWRGYDHSQYYIYAVFARSLSWQGFNWSSLNEFTYYYPFDQPTICGHTDTDGGASLLFHSSTNNVYKVYTSNGTTWVGTAGSYPGLLIGSNSFSPAVISSAIPTLVPYVWTTNSAAPYVIPFQKYNEVTHTLAKEDANVPGNSSKKPVTFTASQSVLLSNSSGNDKYLINFSGLQFSKQNTASLPVSLLANSGRNNSLISLNSDNTANSVSSSDGYILTGSIKYSGQTTGTRIKVVLMDTVNNNIVQQLTGLTISNPDELDAVNIQVPLNNGINLKNTAVKFLINGIIDTSFTSTLVNTYFLNDSTNVQVKQTAGLAETVPTEYALNQNYPNPFNPSTVIEYQLPKEGYVTLKVFDILGREVKTLVNGYKSQGRYSVSFDASKFASGIYIYELKSNDFSSIKKMILTK
ncbi:MAG: T9SS type A sorting domain-containing protein, partial [Ignavibacteriaceae bacterium]|nr:T9SS type A sorting domain-containing protein [Ignavibacteriaceae bacterium]